MVQPVLPCPRGKNGSEGVFARYRKAHACLTQHVHLPLTPTSVIVLSESYFEPWSEP